MRDGPQGRELLILVPEPGGAPPRAVVVLSTSLREEDAIARRQLLAGLAALGVVLGLAALGSVLLVRRTLLPLRRIATTAQRVAAGDLAQRVQLDGPADEIGSLAASFDTMTASLQAAFGDLERSDQRSRAFVADASHELRTPLTTLAGFTDVLLRRSAGESADRVRLLAALRREVDRMQRIVDDLLLLAQVDGGLATERQPVDLHAACERVVEQVRPVAGDRRLAVTGRPVLACSDADRLHQILLNLVGNAIRHTAERGVLTLNADSAGDRVQVAVSDDGEGMEDETRRLAFERFTRGGARRGEGAGLGLAIVAGLVRALDGEVEIESTRGRGTTVRMSLPSASWPGEKVRETSG